MHGTQKQENQKYSISDESGEFIKDILYPLILSGGI